MVYNRYIIDSDMVYSIDFLQIDFCLHCLSDDVLKLFCGSLDFERLKYFGKLDCDSGIKHLAKYDLRWWQFGGLHVEVWPRSAFRDIGVSRLDEDGDLQKSSVLVKEVYWILRLKFNPNKNKDNPALQNVLSFLFRCGWVSAWHFSRVDYALDVQGSLSAFYVLSRKTETNYGSTRYYGKRGTSGYLRVYDKRKEQIETIGDDIGFEWTRFEWEQRGNLDFDFTFDQFSRMDMTGLEGAASCLKFVAPENINQALLCFGRTTRAKLKKQLFSPAAVKKELFQRILDDYIKEYRLSGLRVFTDSQLWAMEDCT